MRIFNLVYFLITVLTFKNVKGQIERSYNVGGTTCIDYRVNCPQGAELDKNGICQPTDSKKGLKIIFTQNEDTKIKRMPWSL